MEKTTNILLVSILFLGMAASALEAPPTIDEVKASMLKRLPVINELKAAKTVGENNMGYLVILKDDPPPEQRKLVGEENTDRKTVYAHIATKAGSTPEEVGSRRAMQIAKQSAPGIMLQNEKGAWYEKE